MVIKIKSKNPDFLSIINKNPDTDFGLYTKKFKNGNLFGVVENPEEYTVFFIDTDKESYAEYNGNQIDFQSFCNPQVVFNAITELFGEMLDPKYLSKTISWLGNKKIGDLDNQKCDIYIPSFYIDSTWYRDGKHILERYFSGLSVKHEIGHIYSVSYTGSTIFETLNFISLFSLLATITNEKKFVVEQQLINKYVRILTSLKDVPYFVFYLFIKRCIITQEIFETVKDKFIDYFKDNQYPVLKFCFEDTHGARIKSIYENIGLENDIVDIGCGELRYARKFFKHEFKNTYYAYDISENFPELFNKFKRNFGSKYDLSGLTKLETLDTLKTIEIPFNIILTEVIEHNTVDESKRIISDLLTTNFNKFIITTPNSEFNMFYFLNEDLDVVKRREDHLYEFNGHQFKEFMLDILKDKYDYEFIDIGDEIKVNNKIVTPTQGIIITKK